MTGRGRLLVAGVAIAAVGSLAVAGAEVAWHWTGEDRIVAPAPPAPPTRAEAEALDLSPILAYAPFGAPPPAPAAPEAAAPETALDLVLEGVVLNDAAERSLALIRSDGETRGYRAGDAVTEAARLISVATDHVVLEVGGSRRVLSFPRRGDAPEREAEGAGSGGLTGLQRLRAAVGDGGGGGAAEPGPETLEDHVSMWRERINRNPAEVLDTIGLVPTDGGYRVADDPDSGVRRAGLRPGDLVARVNGQAVGSVEADAKFVDDVVAAGVARIEVERDGRTMTMTFPLR